MTTKEVMQEYLESVKQKKGLEPFLSEDIVFVSFTSPVRQLSGKRTFLDSTKRFYSMINSMEVKDLIIEGESVCALTHYELQPPQGSSFGSDVAEIYKLKNGKINYFAIYFDTAPYPK